LRPHQCSTMLPRNIAPGEFAQGDYEIRAGC